MLREIVVLPAPILRRTAHTCKAVRPEYVKEVVKDLIETAIEQGNAAGLAAPQIGVPLRIVVVKFNNIFVPFINPKITLAMGAQRNMETCLSIPGYAAEVERARLVKVRAEKMKVTLTDWHAAVIQHEIDHLDGILMIDRQVVSETEAA